MILHQGALKKSRFLGGEGVQHFLLHIFPLEIRRQTPQMQLQETKLTLNLNRVFTQVACIYANLLEQKKNTCIRNEFNSHRISLGHQHGHRFIVLGHQYGRRDVMCILSILQSVSHVYFPSLSILFLLWKGVGGCVITTSSLSVLHPSINQSE